MKIINPLIRFLGGITFAILLITTTAIFVIAGTFLESITDSHRYASLFTYDSHIFSWLLWGFFINILVSALRRWPFKRMHIPFLITHWGLLMILAGLLIKSAYGTQGSLSLIEGSGSNEIFIADSHALYIEEPSENSMKKVSHFRHFKKRFPSHSPVEGPEALNITLLNYRPHSVEKLTTWIKGDKAILSGIPPFPVHSVTSGKESLPGATKILLPNSNVYCDALAILCIDIKKTAENAYLENMQISIGDHLKGQTLLTMPIQKFLNEGAKTPYGAAKGTLHFNWSPISGFLHPSLNIMLERESGVDVISISLSGDEALLNKSTHKTPLSFDLSRPQLLLFLQEPRGDLYFFQYSANGELIVEPFRQDNLKSLIVYNEGFGGYAIQTEVPIFLSSHDRREREKAQEHLLAIELRQRAADIETLPLPLGMLFQSCGECKKAIAETTIEYLNVWDHGRGWLLNDLPESFTLETKEVMTKINWQHIPSDIYRGCLWCAYLFNKLDPLLISGIEPEAAMKNLNWPAQLWQAKDPALSPLESVTLQIFAAACQLPDPPASHIQPSSATLLSALLRAYSIHPGKLLESDPSMPMAQTIKLWVASHHFIADIRQATPEVSSIAQLSEDDPTLIQINSAYLKLLKTLGQDVENQHFTKKELQLAVNIFSPLESHHPNAPNHSEDSSIQLECALTASQFPTPPLKKLENNCPCILLRVQSADREETVSLGYDRFATRIKWPILGGRYLVRFQPLCKKIPYRLRLRQARQINYAGSQQPYSYECDLLITQIDNGNEIEKTISMNEVHETWEGYRFYLASVYPPSPGEIKRVQIVVNYDPAKYLVTYPGALILTLGIFLLFWKKKKK